MYTAVFQEVKTIGVITSIWFNKMLRDSICILQWSGARMYVTLHYRYVKADVFDNHTVSWVEQKNNKNVHLLITLKTKNNSDFIKRQLSLTFSKNTLGRRITQIKYNLRQIFALSYLTMNGSRIIASILFLELRSKWTINHFVLWCSLMLVIKS